ncbi:hypothetical protein, partial [Streptomyces cahuitamycinicus]
ANVEKEFEEAQRILVDDARLLPLWQGRQYVAASRDISGAERAGQLAGLLRELLAGTDRS